MLGPGGVRPPPGSTPALDDDGFPASYAGSRQIYLRQKVREPPMPAAARARFHLPFAACPCPRRLPPMLFYHRTMPCKGALRLHTLLVPTACPAPHRCPRAPQMALLAMLVVDIIYLAVLLILRLVWGGNSDEPEREHICLFVLPARSATHLLQQALWSGVVFVAAAGSHPFPKR